SGRAYVLVFQGERSSVFNLPWSGEILIGRSETAGLRLVDKSISRQHAEIRLVDGEALLMDLHSQSGTRVNGVSIDGPRSLVSGDVIALGSATLVFHRSLGPPERGPTLGLSQLRQRAIEELERGLRHERSLTVLALNARVT